MIRLGWCSVRSESCTDGAWFLPALLLLACFGVAVLVSPGVACLLLAAASSAC